MVKLLSNDSSNALFFKCKAVIKTLLDFKSIFKTKSILSNSKNIFYCLSNGLSGFMISLLKCFDKPAKVIEFFSYVLKIIWF